AHVAARARDACEARFELAVERSPIRQTRQWIGVRFVLRLLEARGVVDHRRGLLADATEDAPVLVGEAARNRVVDDQAADQTSFEDERAGQQRRQIFAVRVAAVGALLRW